MFSQRIYASVLVFSVCLSASVSRSSVAAAQTTQAACVSMSTAQTDEVFNQALATIQKLSTEAVKAQERGAWRPDGSFRTPFFTRASRSLRKIRSLLRTLPDNATQCFQAHANACATVAVPKSDLLQAFDDIFEVRFPSGLQSLRSLKRSERRKFVREIDKLADSYTACNS